MLRTLVFAAIAAACSLAHGAKPELGEFPDEISVLEYVDGGKFTFQELRGKPLLFYVGADWCGPCRERGRPAVERANKRFGDKIHVVFASMDDNVIRQQKIDEARTLGLKILMPRMDLCKPGDCSVGRDFGTFGRIYIYPTAFVFDASGRLRAKIERGHGIAAGLEPAIEKLLAK